MPSLKNMEIPKAKPALNIDLTTIPWIECSDKNRLYETKILFKRISPLISPTGKEELFPAEIIVCDKCKKVPKFFWDKVKDIPEDLKSTCEF